MSGEPLKTASESLDVLIGSMNEPLLKPVELIRLLSRLPHSVAPKFRQALCSIGDGIEMLKDVREALEDE